MTDRYVGIGGNDANSGLTWALRKLTLNGAEDTPVVAGDRVFVGPGTYREMLTVDVSGGNSYAAGTVSVTNGSKVVTGAGTAWLANAYARGIFRVHSLAGGADGVTNAGTNVFTSAAGNFQAGHVGYVIRINTVGAYIIAGVAAANQITVVNPDGSAPVFAGAAGLTYDVGPESPYEIASVDLDTQITLTEPWGGPSFTGLAYETWQDIKYIADLTGQNTDGVGGMVRITGSNNDTTGARANCITALSMNYRTFRGFALDLSNGSGIALATACGRWIVEDCYLAEGSVAIYNINMSGTGLNNTIRRSCFNVYGGGQAVRVVDVAAVDNCGHLIENCLFLGMAPGNGPTAIRVGGLFVRNCTMLGLIRGIWTVSGALTVGQAITARHNNIFGCTNGMASQTAVAVNLEIVEDHNNVFLCSTARINVTTGANSKAVPPLFQPIPLLGNGRIDPWTPFSLQPTSDLRNNASSILPPHDLFGTPRSQEANPDWGAIENQPPVTKVTFLAKTAVQIAGRGYSSWLIPVTSGVLHTITVSVAWDNDAGIGLRPQILLQADYGVSEQVATAVGDGTAYETLTITATPNADGVMILRLVNRSTNAAAINAYFAELAVA